MGNGASVWALILAGGDGSRLRALTTQIDGDARPKQFSRILEGETLLDRTRSRVALVVPSDQHVVVVSRPHEPYFRGLEHEIGPRRLVVQPANRGTTAGIVYPLLRITALAGRAPVAIFPSDHYVSDDRAFMAGVVTALTVVRARPERVVLLGIEADHPETEYGWIEPAPLPLSMGVPPAFAVRRFWEKPEADLAARLLERGCLWNSFVMVGWSDALLGLVQRTVPELIRAFGPVRQAAGSAREEHAASLVYRTVPALSFSQHVLAASTDRLATVPVRGVDWSDWGRPERVIASLGRAARRPAWLARVRLTPTA